MSAPGAPHRMVIVGASLAGATAAATLRKEGFEGEVVLVGEEPRPPYERPELSKSYLRGEVSFDRLLVRPEGFWDEHGIELRPGVRAVAIDVERRTVRLSDADDLPFDGLLLATGCRNRAPAIPGAEVAGVHLLRTVEDCDRLRAEALPGRSVVVCGMGFIGTEVAASLRQLGLEVSAVVSDAFPLTNVLGEALGRAVDEIHRANGVRLVSSDRVAAIEGRDRVEAVLTRNGERLACELAVLALGVEPAVELTAGTPIDVGNGVEVDERCRTNVEGVYAAGDVASFIHPTIRRRTRVEHWQNARRHGRAAAKSMLGADEPYREVPWFWSDQFDHELQFAGFHGDWDAIEVQRDTRGVLASFSSGGVLAAAAALDRPDDVRSAIARLSARARPSEPAQPGEGWAPVS